MNRMYDLIIKNGTVINPASALKRKMDIYIKDGLFVTHNTEDRAESEKTIDAEGCLVTPGLIDSHIHLFEGGSELGGKADLICPPSCVTTAIDAGTSGLFNFKGFYENNIQRSCTTIKATIDTSPTGVQIPPYEEMQDPIFATPEKLRPLFRKYGNSLVGIKQRVHAEVTREFGLSALAQAAETSRILREEGYNCRLMVHFGNLAQGISVEDVVGLLAKGDVLTHIYRTNGTTIFGEDNKVLSYIQKARERGVVFESGCARAHLSLVNMQKALAQGFTPQIISTDLIGKTFYWRPSFSLMFKMSIYLNAGMPVEEIIKAVTYTPASVYGLLDEAGTIESGKWADVAIFKIIDKDFLIEDLYGGTMQAQRVFVPMATVKCGKPVFQQIFL